MRLRGPHLWALASPGEGLWSWEDSVTGPLGLRRCGNEHRNVPRDIAEHRPLISSAMWANPVSSSAKWGPLNVLHLSQGNPLSPNPVSSAGHRGRGLKRVVRPKQMPRVWQA